MSYTQTQLDELTAAIASGTLNVRHSDGRSVTYQSLAEMRKLRSDMQAEIKQAAGTKKRRRTMRMYQSGNGL
ncbi:MAG TPA: hypothetical protein PKH39_15195 [Woeseiaceae bacterium]|nr:hypothetical protein [Woeseiaceae bacterium]